MKYYKQPKTESEIRDWIRGARAYTEWSLEEIERLKQENEDLRIALLRAQREADEVNEDMLKTRGLLT